MTITHRVISISFNRCFTSATHSLTSNSILAGIRASKGRKRRELNNNACVVITAGLIFQPAGVYSGFPAKFVANRILN